MNTAEIEDDVMDAALREQYQCQLERCADGLRRFVAQRVRSHADAEDIAQQAMLQAWVKLGTFRGGSLEAWLFTIARRLVLDHYRAQRRFRVLEVTPAALAESEPALQTSSEAVQIACECRARLGSWVDCVTRRLPLEEQVAVLLADVHGYRDRESAAALGISLASFKLLLHRARARLRAIADGACTLLENSRAASGETKPGSANGKGRAEANTACANGHPADHCRLGIRCCRQEPRLQSLRASLLGAFSDYLLGSGARSPAPA